MTFHPLILQFLSSPGTAVFDHLHCICHLSLVRSLLQLNLNSNPVQPGTLHERVHKNDKLLSYLCKTLVFEHDSSQIHPALHISGVIVQRPFIAEKSLSIVLILKCSLPALLFPMSHLEVSGDPFCLIC